MDLLGLATPEKPMSLNATMEPGQENEVLQAGPAEAYGAALAERDREIAELRARLGDAGNRGPPALTVLLAGQLAMSYRLPKSGCRCGPTSHQQRQTWYTSRTSEFLQPERRLGG